MNSEWQNFLQNHPANATQTQRMETTLYDLSYLSLIRVGGEEAQQFLQGQLTNDIRQVTSSHSQLGGFCTPKGRMLANFRLLLHGADYLLLMPETTAAPFLKRLTMYVLMTKVTVISADDTLVTMGISGPRTEQALGREFSAVPTAINGTHHENGVTLLRVASEIPRFLIIGEVAGVGALWDTLREHADSGTTADWRLMDIRAGIPTITKETSETFVPQMTNMQLIDGVSFTKGCYTGQEVVARMRYLGKLKRQMYLAEVESNTLPAPGTDLFSESSASGQGAGKVVNAEFADENRVELLAVVENSSQVANNVHLGDVAGPKLKFLDLPYALEES